MTIGEIFNYVRKERNWTLQDVCDAGDYEFTPSQLSKIERKDERRSSFELITLIAKALEIPLAMLDGRVSQAADLKYMLNDIKKTTPEAPLIEWKELSVLHLLPSAKSKETHKRLVRSHVTVNAPSNAPLNVMAVTVLGEEMESNTGGPSFPPGCILYIDCNRTAKPGDFVIAKIKERYIFRQLKQSDDGLVLKPLNMQYRMIPLNSEDNICSVIIASQHYFTNQ